MVLKLNTYIFIILTTLNIYNVICSITKINLHEKDIWVGTVHASFVRTFESHTIFEMERNIKNALSKKKDCVVVDVGMNDGFYTNVAGSMGCIVYGFEIQKKCINIAKEAIIKNKIENQPVSYTNHTLHLPSSDTACDGLYSLGREDCPKCPKRDSATGYVDTLFTSVALDIMFPSPTVLDFVKVCVCMYICMYMYCLYVFVKIMTYVYIQLNIVYKNKHNPTFQGVYYLYIHYIYNV